MSTSTKVDVNALADIVDSLKVASNSFGSNSPTTKDNLSEVLLAFADAGFDTRSMKKYDTKLDDLSMQLTEMCTTLDRYVGSTNDIDRKIDEEVPDEDELFNIKNSEYSLES